MEDNDYKISVVACGILDQQLTLLRVNDNIPILYCIVLQFIYSRKKCTNKNIAHTKS